MKETWSSPRQLLVRIMLGSDNPFLQYLIQFVRSAKDVCRSNYLIEGQGRRGWCRGLGWHSYQLHMCRKHFFSPYPSWSMLLERQEKSISFSPLSIAWLHESGAAGACSHMISSRDRPARLPCLPPRTRVQRQEQERYDFPRGCSRF